MNAWRIVKALNYGQLWSLTLLGLRHPLFMWATTRATVSTFAISQKEFPNIHGKHNKANAFRHALWSVLIAKKSARFSTDTLEVLQWTQRITDWHEDFSPNEPLAEAMDLHNNKIGRDLYLDLGQLPANSITHRLKAALTKAQKISQLADIEKYPQQFVYIED